MKPWHLRPQEVANLLNPAFCAQVLYATVQSHVASNDRPLPYALAFIVLPLVLHRATRDTMDGRTTHFQTWLNGHEEVKIGFSARARQTVPYTREALIFSLQTGSLALAPNGGLATGTDLKRIRRKVPQVDENEACIGKAAILGRWLANAGSPATVFASIGVQP